MMGYYQPFNYSAVQSAANSMANSPRNTSSFDGTAGGGNTLNNSLSSMKKMIFTKAVYPSMNKGG